MPTFPSATDVYYLCFSKRHRRNKTSFFKRKPLNASAQPHYKKQTTIHQLNYFYNPSSPIWYYAHHRPLSAKHYKLHPTTFAHTIAQKHQQHDNNQNRSAQHSAHSPFIMASHKIALRAISIFLRILGAAPLFDRNKLVEIKILFCKKTRMDMALFAPHHSHIGAYNIGFVVAIWFGSICHCDGYEKLADRQCGYPDTHLLVICHWLGSFSAKAAYCHILFG